MKALITGAAGMTGRELVRQLCSRNHTVTALTRAELDVTDSGDVEAAINAATPDVVFHAAGFTGVDAAEESPDLAMAVNAGGTGNVARAAEQRGALLIHISTDYVFAGDKSQPYHPDDAPGPINAYGRSKLAGEIAARNECRRHAIVRTSWVFSHEGHNFLRTMLRAGATQSSLSVVNDQHGCPTSAADLAAALVRVSEVLHNSDEHSGIYHFCNSGITTWHGFASAIFGMRSEPAPQLRAVSSEEYPTVASRPAWSALDCSSFATTFDLAPRPWVDALRETMALIP